MADFAFLIDATNWAWLHNAMLDRSIVGVPAVAILTGLIAASKRDLFEPRDQRRLAPLFDMKPDAAVVPALAQP